MSNGPMMTGKRPARYELIADYLKDLIAKAAPGDRLPSEAELCERFEVSRMTARQAVQVVANDGLIERRRGAGTFVRAHPVPRDLGSPLSFSGSMRARGMTASSETLEWGEVVPDSDERTALGLQAGDNAYVLKRLRLADGTPMAIERVVMPRELALALGEDFQSGSLHDAFRAVGRVPTEAHAEVSARRATKNERELLGLPPSGIIISERRTIYDQEDSPLERTETHYAASRYTFRAILRESEKDR
ncbi:MAG: GntR family transcriptional regulator [Actinomycetota bacterium]